MKHLSRREFNHLMMGAAVTGSTILGIPRELWAAAGGAARPAIPTNEVESQFMFHPAFGPEVMGMEATDYETSNFPLSFVDTKGYELSPSQIVAMGEQAPAIPKALNGGSFIRNGSNPRFVTNWPYHWFDGDGMLHKVHFEDGKATYSNRFVRTKKFENEEKAEKALYGGFNSGPKDANIGDYIQGGPLYPDISNTDLISHNGKLYSTCAMVGELYEVNPETLETSSTGTENFDGKMKHLVAAHSKVDQEGVLHAYGFDLKFAGLDAKLGIKRPAGEEQNYLYYYQVSADGKTVKYNSVPLDVPRNMHDMAMTDDYVILLNQPVEMKGGITFDKSKPSEFVFIDKKDPEGEKIVIEGEADSILHTGNAYQDGDFIYLYAMDISNIDGYGGYGPNYKRMLPQFTVWKFDMKNKSVEKKAVSPANGPLGFTDFPVINEKYLGLQNQYTYMGGLANGHQLFILDKILKYDEKNNEKKTLYFGNERWGSEFSFVPDPERADKEDGGYLVGYVVYTGDDPLVAPSECWIVDAETMKVVTRLAAPHRIPSGFHGMWLPDSSWK